MNLPDDLAGARIKLADYESHDLRFLKGATEWPLTFHRMVIRAIARILRRRGANVEIIKIKMVEYFDWLTATGFGNTPAMRARYISEITK